MKTNRRIILVSLAGFATGVYLGLLLVLYFVIPLVSGEALLAEAKGIPLFLSFINRASWQAVLLAAFIIFGLGVFGLTIALDIIFWGLLKEEGRKLTAALDSSRAKDEFISMVLHHLRTPLSGIKWSLKEITKKIISDNPLRSKLTQLAKENDRALDAIKHLIEASQASMERIVYNFEVVSIGDFFEFVKEIIEALRAEIQAKEILLEVVVGAASDDSVKADKEKMATVIQTLIENAVAYTDKGGLIRIHLEEKGSEFIFQIADTGVGISEKDKSEIFSQFFRSEKARKMEPGGFGIGLFLVKTFLQHHRGDIRFDSQEGKGTTFYFHLPVVKISPEKFLETL